MPNYIFLQTWYQRIFKGIGQIMLQEHALAGLFFLAGIAYGSVLMAIAALSGAVVGTLTAYFFGFEKEETDKGLYGFSPALTGAACILFFYPDAWVWVFLIIGSVLAAGVQNFFIRKKIPVFTLPFVVVTWILYSLMAVLIPDSLRAPEDIPLAESNYLFISLKGYGQVIFQNQVLSGVLFFIGVFIFSPVGALYGLMSAGITANAAAYAGVPPESVQSGLLSFNAVICAIVFAGNTSRHFVLVLLSVTLSFLSSVVMLHLHLMQLTFPFVAASMVVGTVQRTRNKGESK